MTDTNALQKLRKKFRYSQQQIANFLDISRPSYSQVEAGNRELKESEVMILAELFDLSPSEIIRRDSIDYYERIARQRTVNKLQSFVDSYEDAEQIYDKYIKGE
jgi:transcriptional regulator with XRE-family HTH domain